MTRETYIAYKKSQPDKKSNTLYVYKRYKKPWYYLTKEESITINKKNNICSNLTNEELLSGILKNRIKKWEQKHRKPCNEDDIFAKEYLKSWEEERKKAIESFKKKRKERVTFVLRYRLPNDDFINKKVLTIKCIVKETNLVKEKEKTKLAKRLKHIMKPEINKKDFVCGHLYINEKLWYVAVMPRFRKTA